MEDIINIKIIGVDVRFNNKLQAVVQDPLDERLNTILQFGEMALQMKGGQGKRYKQFTQDTAQAIHHTCIGIVSLWRFLLRVSHNFVLLGTFSTDPLDKEFGKLPQGSGGTYCSFLLDENSAEIFGSLPELILSVPEDTKMVLVYIADYVTRNDSGSFEEKLFNEETFYHQKYGQNLYPMDTGELSIPTDNTCQWSIFCFILFNAVKEKVC